MCPCSNKTMRRIFDRKGSTGDHSRVCQHPLSSGIPTTTRVWVVHFGTFFLVQWPRWGRQLPVCMVVLTANSLRLVLGIATHTDLFPPGPKLQAVLAFSTFPILAVLLMTVALKKGRLPGGLSRSWWLSHVVLSESTCMKFFLFAVQIDLVKLGSWIAERIRRIRKAIVRYILVALIRGVNEACYYISVIC